jgi:hypothetical protein
MSRLLAIASIFFCFEIGLFLVFIPWSELWEGNYLLLTYTPVLRPYVLHNAFRLAVTGLGGIDIFIGLSELRHFLKSIRVPDRMPE